jgi:hypothetical protein
MRKVKEYIKKIAAENRFLAPIYFNIALPYFTGKFKKQIKENLVFDLNDPESLKWRNRIEDVKACSDNQYIK